jgi:cyclohexanecarboxylate-CoA ligase
MTLNAMTLNAMTLSAMTPAALAARYRAEGYWTDATLRDWLALNARDRGAHDALRQGDARVTWSALAQDVAAFEHALARLGIAKGDVVAVQLPNSTAFVIAYLAITGHGAIMQTVHMPYREAELRALLAHSGAKAAIVLAQAKDYAPVAVLRELARDLPELKTIIAVGGSPEGAIDFGELLSDAASGSPPATVPLTGADPFLLLYTSGTTTAPKGVPHAYRNFLANSRLSAVELSVSADDVLLCAAPFTHLYGLFTLNMALAVGATSRLLPAFSPPDFAAMMTSGEPTLAFTAPAHIAACLAGKLFEGKSLASLRYVQISGSTVAPELGRRFEPLLPHGKVMQLWGMTELQAGAFTRLADSEAVRIETTGRPSPGTELRVIGDDDRLAAPGDIGELQMRGPSLFEGYFNNPEATADAFTKDGWFRTGDLASIDALGQTRLAGRTKDIINRGGVKWNPIDVESAMLQHPSVVEAAVIPLPDPVLGERACLCVTLRPDTVLTFSRMQAWLGDRGIAKLKWPERLEVLDAMPLTPTRKIIKSELVRLVATKG